MLNIGKNINHISNRQMLMTAFVLSVIVFAVMLTGCAKQEAPKIKVGVAEMVITPPIGVPMAGYARNGVSTGVHDDLYARALVIEDSEGETVALMTLGIINLHSADRLNAIRQGISQQTGIPEHNIVVSCTHTHSGPSIGGAGEEYQKFLIDTSAATVVKAWESRVPGRIGFGTVEALEVGRNDRRMEYGGLHPDPETAIIKVEDASGKLMGVAFNFGCHPSTLDLHNLEFTEDWPYYAITDIKNSVGEDVWVAYYQSAQGDVKVGYTAELSAVGAEMPIRNFWYAGVKGSQMAGFVLDTLPGITTSGDLTVEAAWGTYEYPLRESYPITNAEAVKRDKDAKARLASMEAKADDYGKRVLDRARVDVFLTGLAVGCSRWVEEHPNPEPLVMEQQAVRIGDAVFATFPNEVFSEIGLAVKKRSPMEKTFVIGLASGHGGYIPTAEEFREGGYASDMTRFSPKCGDVVANAALELIGKVAP